MFSKIKDVKKKIQYAKYGAIIFAVVFITQLIATVYLLVKVSGL